jgi:TatD DNase family protein
MKKYIDIHAHKNKSADDLIALQNLFPNEKPKSEGLYSAGLHPWHVREENIDGDMGKIKELLKQDNVIAVGECGLDRARGASFEVQEKVFSEQIKIANEFQVPMIIHCVRAYPDLIRLKKQKKNRVPWIIHGFNGNHQIAQELLKHGFYLSFGMKNLEEKVEIFKELPIKTIFLETDESGLNIKDVYEKSAKIKDIIEDNMIEEINENFKKIFGSIYK